jgi:hypothetical protein
MRLHAGQWEARVLTPQQFRNDPLTAAVVVACANKDDLEKSQQWHAARGAPVGITLVDMSDKNGPSSVMVMGPTGPLMRPATLVHLGANAPRPRALPQGVVDDAVMDQQQKEELALCRLTVSREFAPTDILNKAMRYPQCLPGLTLDAARQKRVISTKAAVTHEDEATCLIQLAKADVQSFLDAKLPTGVFLMRHREETVPQWLQRPADMPSDKYWARRSSSLRH